ncbi:MAG TPA: AP endonuclease, partial [Ruminiclostridium sp.]|nr:AP endonuclease [Ruminiclostridium sp.]
DLSPEELCSLVSSIGYQGIEAACHAHLDVRKALEDDQYVMDFHSLLKKYNLGIWAISAHLIGQCVGDNWDPRLDNFAPGSLSGKPDEIRDWAVEEMKAVARAAKKLGIHIVTCFMGSPIWAYWYSYPQTPQKMVDQGFERIKELWDPILDVFDECDVKLALEIHPAEIAFDYYTTEKLLKTFEFRPALGINFDPSHLVWQGV